MVEGYSQPPSERRSAHYQPTAWNSDFVNSSENHNNNDEIQKQRAEKLKGEVRAMIGDTDAMQLAARSLPSLLSLYPLSGSVALINRKTKTLFCSLSQIGPLFAAGRPPTSSSAIFCW
ncbi:hypothetical protein RHGRI_010021 [Rhododendron griersonianum]|uniref:Uncharacterized protein n=1 Tax=Rhododendron griersonianum TaxID=479676 RepID=A0AAV6KHM6_9ERIC|nr:hypothetical protein RHGRI_010021 [Rhododendron griersonianum]